PDAGRVNREAYSHEVVSFGFWAGDANVREPSYYAYAAPEPADLRLQPLRPAPAHWAPQGQGSIALLPYDSVRTAPDPRAALLGLACVGLDLRGRGAALFQHPADQHQAAEPQQQVVDRSVEQHAVVVVAAWGVKHGHQAASSRRAGEWDVSGSTWLPSAWGRS